MSQGAIISDPVDFVIDLPIPDGLATLFDAVLIWATWLAPLGTRAVAVTLQQEIHSQFPDLEPARLLHWPVQQYREFLLGRVQQRIQAVQITATQTRIEARVQPCSAAERLQRATSLATYVQQYPIAAAIEVFADVVARWAMTCPLSTLRAAIRHAGYQPDETWSDQRYSAFIPYVLADMLAH